MNFTNYLQAQGKSKSTVAHYQRYLLNFTAFLNKNNSSPELAAEKEVINYLDYLKKPVAQGGKGLKNNTRAIRLNVISLFFDYQIHNNLRIEHPIQNLKIRGSKRQKLYPSLSKRELEQLYSNYHVPTKENPNKNRNWFTAYQLSRQRNKVIISLMINQGITTSEATNIELIDLSLKEGKLTIKGGRKSNGRILELKSNQIMDLMEYQFTTRNELLSYQNNTENKSLFLPNPTLGNSKIITKNSLQIWKSLTKELKLQNPKFINFKQVRSSVIARWLTQYNLREVQYMAGHRFVSSTEKYFANQMEDLQTDIDKFHPLG